MLLLLLLLLMLLLRGFCSCSPGPDAASAFSTRALCPAVRDTLPLSNSQRTRVWALIVCTCGGSQDFGPETVARDVMTAVSSLSLAPIVLVGHSMGGKVCIWCVYRSLSGPSASPRRVCLPRLPSLGLPASLPCLPACLPHYPAQCLLLALVPCFPEAESARTR